FKKFSFECNSLERALLLLNSSESDIKAKSLAFILEEVLNEKDFVVANLELLPVKVLINMLEDQSDVTKGMSLKILDKLVGIVNATNFCCEFEVLMLKCVAFINNSETFQLHCLHILKILLQQIPFLQQFCQIDGFSCVLRSVENSDTEVKLLALEILLVVMKDTKLKNHF
uniref:CTLH domain-containing protein n=1 Tax=Mesocestoides corti TaxID=53468 RepID=A0A5K3FEQ7_MESCO